MAGGCESGDDGNMQTFNTVNYDDGDKEDLYEKEPAALIKNKIALGCSSYLWSKSPKALCDILSYL